MPNYLSAELLIVFCEHSTQVIGNERKIQANMKQKLIQNSLNVIKKVD